MRKFSGWLDFKFWVVQQALSDLNIDEFIRMTKEFEPSNKLIPNQVWSSYRPVWVEDITDDSTFLRREAAIKNDLHGALAFPFYSDTQLSGVIELFKRDLFEEEVDELMLNLITSIGIEIGLYIQQKAEEEFKSQLSTVINFSVSGIYTTDEKGIIKTWNSSAERIFGWKSQEMVGSSIKKIYPEDRMGEFDQIKSVLQSGKTLEFFQTERVAKDGRRVWIKGAYGPINDPFGNLIGACIVIQDISMQKTQEELLARVEERFKIFIELTEEWIWEVDQGGNFQFSNSAVYKVLGYEIEEVLGRNILEFLYEEDRERIENHLKILGIRNWSHEVIRFVHKNGTIRWHECTALELLGANYHLMGFRGANRDITDYKNLEQIKNEFISIVSHELKNPLASIYGALTLLTKKELDPKDQANLLNTAQRNSELLAKIINDIMDVERLQLGKLKLEIRKIPLKEIILDSIKSSETVLKKCEVKIVTDKLCDVEVNGDSQRLTQVMMNLLSNAIKFSPNGSTIEVSMIPDEQSVKICVKDHGRGIPKDFQPKIFEKFAQADSSSRRAYGGAGLGLYICKSIIDGHGGKIGYQTSAGDGTTFFFELPKVKE